MTEKWLYWMLFCTLTASSSLPSNSKKMRTEQSKQDILNMIQEKRNEFQRFGSPYDDAEIRIEEQSKNKEDEQPETDPLAES
jgi:hypothetical protein